MLQKFVIPFFQISSEYDSFCCLSCVKELERFHNFLEKIKSKHQLNDEDVFIKCEALEPEGDQENPEGLENEGVAVHLEADVTTEILKPTETKKRGRPKTKKTVVKVDKVNRKIGRPRKADVVDIKSEEPENELMPKKTYRRRTVFDETKILNSIDMKCDLCNEPLESFGHALIHHQEVHGQKGYLMCCSRKFRQKSALVDHLDFHANPEHFQCQTCQRNFGSLSNLRTHITISHLPQTRFQCDVCGKFINCKYRLTSHLKTHLSHSKSTDKFPCLEKDCGKIFRSKLGLKSHNRICHNPNRDTFSCEICGKQLMTRTSLKDHVENTHAEKIVKIQCQLCGHYIKNEYSMKKHLNRHKQMTEDITCEYCGKKCTTKAALRSHLRMKHLLQRNFKCCFCEKSFKQAIDQKEHEATHTGIDLYSCLWCSATFKFGANFRAHRKSVHPEEYEKIKPAWLRPN